MNQDKGIARRVEEWLSKVPGLRTYRCREHRRETDKRLREHIASRLMEGREGLMAAAGRLSREGRLNHLSRLDQVASRIQHTADTIRYARYGYHGIFDVERIGDKELNALYEFDLSLLDMVDRILAQVPDLRDLPSAEALEKALNTLEDSVESLEKTFQRRGEFLTFSS